MTPSLAPAGAEDAADMAAILIDWVRETPWMPELHSPTDTRDFCANLAPCTVLARQGGQTLGFIARREADILCLYVARPARSSGIGAALVRHAQSLRPKLALWTFAANTRARAFYARHGFLPVASTEGDNDEGLPDIRLEWRQP